MAVVMLWKKGASAPPVSVAGEFAILPSRDALELAVLHKQGKGSCKLLGRLDLTPDEETVLYSHLHAKYAKTRKS